MQTVTSLLRLSDGRILEFAEFGDPQGIPMFFFHGFAGSCHQARLSSIIAKQQHVRVIAPNRPGVGQSTPYTFASMTDYARDMEELADHLGIDAFSAIGASGGGGFALATAYALPQRVQLVGVCGGIGPLDVEKNLLSMEWRRRTFLWLCHHYPRMSMWLLRVFALCCRAFPLGFFHLMIYSSHAMMDRSLLKDKRIRQMLWNDYKSIFLQKNGMKGMLQEIHLYFRWGFPIEKFPRNTSVVFWHGHDDVIAPQSIVQDIAASMRRAHVVEYPGGHVTFLMTGLKTIVERMRATSTATSLSPSLLV